MCLSIAIAILTKLQCVNAFAPLLRLVSPYFAVRAHPDISHHRRLDVRHAQLEQLGGALHGPRLHPASVAKVVVVEGGATNAAGQN